MSLVSPDEVMAYAGIGDAEDTALVQRLIDQVEAVFLRQCNRSERPFQGVQAARVEIRDGEGGALLFLDYPIAALTVPITLGYASPWDETLDPTLTTTLSFQVGSRRVARVDGGTWGACDQPNYIRVTYNAQADEPEDVTLAIVRVTAALWRESNGPEATSDRTLPDGELLPVVADADPYWQAAIAAHWDPRV